MSILYLRGEAMNAENEKIGNFIKHNREKSGYTQDQLAEIVGVTGSAVSRWENGEVDNIGRNKIIRLAKALRVDEVSILHGEKYEPPDTIAAHADHNLTEEEQEKVKEYIKFLETQRK